MNIGNLWKGEPRIVEIYSGSYPNNFVRPGPGKCWLLLGGKINHVTGTLTVVSIVDISEPAIAQTLWQVKSLAAADGSADYSIFETIMDVARTGDFQSQWHPFFIMPNMAIYFGGNAAANLKAEVLEFDLA